MLIGLYMKYQCNELCHVVSGCFELRQDMSCCVSLSPVVSVCVGFLFQSSYIFMTAAECTKLRTDKFSISYISSTMTLG